ncbi:MAG: RsmB/NOP family class I SAM-dependent RNA methyltransferase [Candidatus Bathyarchaeota archaeon]|nr:RsmB/NOP family class I SAM-dependent RNA methyltransferase [Candidatus Bathyarchaeota archaeon]
MSGWEWFMERYRAMGSTLTGDETTPQAIRINPLQTTDEKLVETLTEQGVELEKIPYLDHGYKVRESPFSLGASIEYLLGHYSLQETASQYPVQALQPTQEDRLLDMASAPGGKTTQAAAYMQNKGIIVAVDINRDRLFATENNVERCGVTNTSIHHVDALELPDKEGFTKVLLDAPCSGNYVTDNHWFRRRTEEDIMRNAELQKRLITKALNLLESGGVLLYSTCSLEPEENEQNIQWLIENHDVKLMEIDGPGDPALTNLDGIKLDQKISYCRRFWPEKTGTQGFFVAKVVKQ